MPKAAAKIGVPYHSFLQRGETPDQFLDGIRAVQAETRRRAQIDRAPGGRPVRTRYGAAVETLYAEMLERVGDDPRECLGCGAPYEGHPTKRWCRPACRKRFARVWRRAHGLCTECGHPAHADARLCPACRERHILAGWRQSSRAAAIDRPAARREAVQLVRAGRRVSEVARSTGLSRRTVARLAAADEERRRRA